MTTRLPLVQSAGQIGQLQAGDSITGALLVSRYTVVGTLAVATGTPRWYPDRNITLTGIYFSLGTAPSGYSCLIDVLKNGASIFSGTYPTCTTGNNLSTTVAVSTTMTTSDYLTVNITAVSGVEADMLICIQYQ